MHVLGLVLLLAVSGCFSAIAVRGPKSAKEPGNCSDSYAAPVIDGLIGVGGIVVGAMEFREAKRRTEEHAGAGAKCLECVVGVLIIVPAAVFALGAAAGAIAVHNCRVARAEHEPLPPADRQRGRANRNQQREREQPPAGEPASPVKDAPAAEPGTSRVDDQPGLPPEP